MLEQRLETSQEKLQAAVEGAATAGAEATKALEAKLQAELSAGTKLAEETRTALRDELGATNKKTAERFDGLNADVSGLLEIVGDLEKGGGAIMETVEKKIQEVLSKMMAAQAEAEAQRQKDRRVKTSSPLATGGTGSFRARGLTTSQNKRGGGTSQFRSTSPYFQSTLNTGSGKTTTAKSTLNI